MNLTARMPSVVSSSASANPGRSSYGYQDPEQPVLDDKSGETRRNVKIKLFTGLWSILVFSSVEKWRWKSTIDQGNLIKNSWDSLGKVDPHRGEHLLGRTAHSARNEETIHDRTGRPASENVQGKANFEKFIVGSDTTEFVNKVRNHSANSTEKNVKRCRGLYRTFDNLGNVYGYNIECSDIYGKELFNDAECCAE